MNAVNFPDENFRNYVSGFDKDGGGSLNDSEISAVKIIDVHKDYDELDGRISSLKGIEYFTGLVSLDCSGNDLTEIDVSSNTALVELSCLSNYLSVLDLSSNTALTHLDCSYNHLMALDISKNTSLVYLRCGSNRFTALNVSGHKALQELYCEDDEENTYLKTINASGCTSLTDLNVPYSVTHLNVSGCTSLQELAAESLLLIELNASGCTALTSISCGDNEEQGSLSSLNITGCTALKNLYCNGRKLTSLNLSSCTNLVDLSCNNNALTALDVSRNLALGNLECNHNHLTSLNVGNNTALTGLDCSSNYLTALDVSNNTALTWLDCSENDLTALNVSSNTVLKSLYCSSNKLSDLDVSSNTNIENLHFDDNYISEVDLSSNIALTTLGTAYNQSSSWDVSEYTALEYLYCDFPITAGANSTWEFDFTAFKEAYGIDGEIDYNLGVSIWDYRNSTWVSDFTVDQSSVKYILRFKRLAEGDIELCAFRCRLNDSNRYIDIWLVPSVDASSLTAPLITTSSLPAVSIDNDGSYHDYDYSISVYGSKKYLTWKIIDGFPPAGLYMDYDGEIYGYPRAAGSYTFTVRARNKLGSSTRTFTIVVPYLTPKEPPIITTTSLTGGTSGIPYGCQLTVDGTAPITWIADDLLDGFALSSTGYISGTPTESGTFSMSITAENAYDSDSRTLSLTVAEAPSGTKPSITTDALDAATAGSAYSYQLGVSGTPPITWTVKGKLPNGLSMNSSGLITGTPKVKGTKPSLGR